MQTLHHVVQVKGKQVLILLNDDNHINVFITYKHSKGFCRDELSQCLNINSKTNNTSNSLRALSCGYECVHMHKNTKHWRITITANHKMVEITCKQASWQHTRNTYQYI